MVVKGTKTGKKERSDAPKKQGFNLQIPAPLYDRLKEYMDDFERLLGVRPSMTKLFIQAMEEKLPDLESRIKGK